MMVLVRSKRQLWKIIPRTRYVTRNTVGRLVLFLVGLFVAWCIYVGFHQPPKVLIGTIPPPPKPKVLIVTLNMGNHSIEYEDALRNHECYARCHGYDFRNAPTATYNLSVHPYMQKAYALQHIFSEKNTSEYDYILWIDRDAIFMNHKVSIPDRLNQLKAATGTNVDMYSLFIAVEAWAWLNSGVLLFRNTQSSRRLIDDWIRTYHERATYYRSNETILIGGKPTMFRDLFKEKWSCEDQGAIIALLAGYNAGKKWNTDKFDGLGVPHVLHEGHDEWAAVSSGRILDPQYQAIVKIVGQAWLNTNPWDHKKYEDYENQQGRKSIDAFIFHFNGQRNKTAWIQQYIKDVQQCAPEANGLSSQSGHTTSIACVMAACACSTLLIGLVRRVVGSVSRMASR